MIECHYANVHAFIIIPFLALGHQVTQRLLFVAMKVHVQIDEVFKSKSNKFENTFTLQVKLFGTLNMSVICMQQYTG